MKNTIVKIMDNPTLDKLLETINYIKRTNIILSAFKMNKHTEMELIKDLNLFPKDDLLTDRNSSLMGVPVIIDEKIKNNQCRVIEIHPYNATHEFLLKQWSNSIRTI